MKAVYGDKCLSQNRIFEWVRKFKSGIESLDDASRPGTPVKVSDDATTWAIDEMIQKDRHIRIRVISAELNFSYKENGDACVSQISQNDPRLCDVRYDKGRMENYFVFHNLWGISAVHVGDG
ncbi:hypothetical protein LAZ67_3000490 [Cordylochernes scorpioides]|uniref:Transposase n=1 Tax=Cordylochernes scorpioides TaxID=51811 RepID=A0ABY6K775_9ARAC|nr:hypothetical protein LAZ67_3000490 [Cordylochernes scorpioides]